MTAENLPMFDDLPMDSPDGAKRGRHKLFRNDLFKQLNRLLNHFKQEPADLRKATGMSFTTISDWVNGRVEYQALDDNIKRVANHFGISVDFLAYGTPMTDKDLELEDQMADFSDKLRTFN